MKVLERLYSAISSIAFVTSCIRCMVSKIVSRDRAGMNTLNDKAEMRKANIMIVASSDFVYTSKSLFWPDDIMLAAVDLDLMQSESMAIRVLRQTEMNPITIIFAGMNDSRRRCIAIKKGYHRINGGSNIHPERRCLHQDKTENRVCTVSGICTSRGWTEVLYMRWWLCSRKGSMM